MCAVIIFPVVLLKRGAITPLLLSENGQYYSVVLLKRGAIFLFFFVVKRAVIILFHCFGKNAPLLSVVFVKKGRYYSVVSV